MKFSFFSGLFVLALIMTGCGQFIVKEPIIRDELRYDTKHSMYYDRQQKHFRSVFIGERCWYNRNENNNQRDHKFYFDEDESDYGPDKMVVTITDESGVRPGTSLAYVLTQTLNGAPQDSQTWYLTMSTPPDATEVVHTFVFTISLAPGSKFLWDKKKEVSGSYTLGSTDRYAVASLQFYVGNKVNATEFCSMRD